MPPSGTSPRRRRKWILGASLIAATLLVGGLVASVERVLHAQALRSYERVSLGMSRDEAVAQLGQPLTDHFVPEYWHCRWSRAEGDDDEVQQRLLWLFENAGVVCVGLGPEGTVRWRAAGVLD